jgi:hypothetical protein
MTTPDFQCESGFKPPRRWKILLLTHNILVVNCWFMLLGCAVGQTQRQEIIHHVDEAENLRESNLSGYSVTERYEVYRNGENAAAAEMVVETVYKRGGGKQYKVVSKGSGFIQKHVLDRILAEEEQISKGDLRQSVLVTSANYDMEPEREEVISGRRCLVLKLEAKRSSPYLLNGHLWVDAQSYHVVRIDGKTSAMPSIWAGHPVVRRDSKELGGFAVAVASRSVAKNILLGQTVVTIEYQNYRLEP